MKINHIPNGGINMGHYRNFKLVYYFVASETAAVKEEQLEKEIAFFEKYMHPDKVYLEPFRSGVFASDEQVEMCKSVFSRHGIEVAGGITTTMPTPDGSEQKQRLFDTFCYNDPEMINRLVSVSEFLGRHYDEFIIDDFFFTNCTCKACRDGKDAYNREHGITDGSWSAYRLALMEKVSREYMIAPARKVNPSCRITIKYPNWAESYQQTGYNPAEQRELFDMIYTGTETRDTVTTDQHLPRYLSFSLMTYFENMWPGHNGGGWFDPFDLHITEQYLEQAYLTAFSRPKEIMLFCFQALLNNMYVPALGFQLEQLDRILDYAGQPVGIPAYLPDNCHGEDNIQDFLGMCGFPVVCTPYFPAESDALLLTASSACDPDILNKVETYVAAGGHAIATDGFIKAMKDRGIGALTSAEISDRKVTGTHYRIENRSSFNRISYITGTQPVTYPICNFRNNASWALVKIARDEESFPILLRDTYGKGCFYTLCVPDNYPDVYKLPSEPLNRIREEFPVNRIWMEGESGTSLFVYGNDTFILYRYVTSESQPTKVKIHTDDRCSGLELPAINEITGCNSPVIKPLYQDENGDKVFEIAVHPGKYQLFRMKR